MQRHCRAALRRKATCKARNYGHTPKTGSLADGEENHMKIVRFDNNGTPELGYVTEDGLKPLRAARGLTPSLQTALDAALNAADPSPLLPLLPQAAGELQQATADADMLEGHRLLAPLTPRRLLCIGLNYRDHCRESGTPIPEIPVLFSKFPECVIGPGDDVVMPHVTNQVDYEAEFVVVLGRAIRNADQKTALAAVAGYTVGNDVSARDIQKLGGQWVRGKSCDTFAPIGPALVTADEIPDPQKLPISLRLNNETLQDSNTAEMIFPVAELLSFLSQTMTLYPGDLLFTGTPQIFLKPGDRVSVRIGGVGELVHGVRSH